MATPTVEPQVENPTLPVEDPYPGELDPNSEQGVGSRNIKPDVLIDVLKGLVDSVDLEEMTDQDKAVAEARRREFYWRGIQGVFWDEVAKDYKQIVPKNEQEAEALQKIVNVYKADGESIAAAIASSVPQVRFFPYDAENPDDIMTAKAETKLSEVIAEENNAQMLMFQTMYTLWTEPFAAAHINYVEDPAFGYKQIPLYEKKQVQIESMMCPQCGMQMGESNVLGANISQDLAGGMGYDPANDQEMCPGCGYQGPGMPQTESVEIPTQTGMVDTPEGRATIDIYGISHVRIPFYCRRQEDIGYVFLDTEQHYSMLRDIFPHIREKIVMGWADRGQYQKDLREPVEHTNETAEKATCRRIWFRPWIFEMLNDEHEEERETLKEMFPEGILLIFVNEHFAGAWAEGIDEAWEFTKHPMSRYIHNVPLGDAEMPIQDMTNEATNLALDLILHSVPPLIVSPEAVDFDKIGNVRQLPGTWVRGKPSLPGDNFTNKFYQPKPPTFSQYLPNFFNMLDQRRQHVGGAFPSIYGGQPIGGSKTKGEYEMSRAQALQRLGIIWKMINTWWPKVMKKAVKKLRDNLSEDLHTVQEAGNSFINIWIRQSELKGKSGKVRSESSEEFPVSWSQVRGILLELLGLGIPQISEAILLPANAGLMKEIFGLTKLKIPMEEDRRYQLGIIQDLLQSPPLPDGSPSIPPDPLIGDNNACIEVTKDWLIGEVGLDARETNPEGYMNVVAHLQIRMFQQMMEMQQAMAAQNAVTPTPGAPKPAPGSKQGINNAPAAIEPQGAGGGQ